jgi:hypothetical protein
MVAIAFLSLLLVGEVVFCYVNSMMTASVLQLVLGAFITLMVVGFDDQKAGGVPDGWTATLTGKGKSVWTVEKDDTAPSAPMVLKQSGTASFPLCVKNDTSLKNGYVEVKFKPLTGKVDQAAGIVWRYRDAQNYYVVRANALEDNVVLYKMEKGKRSSLEIVGRKGGYGVKQEVAQGKWQTLRVEFVEETFAVSLDGKELFRVKDATFPQAGKVGVWTKADSVTLFDDFTYGKKK